jgi:thiol:disulfide interchange protein DsbC
MKFLRAFAARHPPSPPAHPRGFHDEQGQEKPELPQRTRRRKRQENAVCGLFEVVLKSGELLYTDASASFIIDGNIIDAKTRKNVTQARMLQLMKIDCYPCPRPAIKQVRGNGKRVIASFKIPTAATASGCQRPAKPQGRHGLHFLYPIRAPTPPRSRRTSGAPRTAAA